MGIIIPNIPYKSQLDPDAGDFRNDCGPTCLAMILHAFGVEVSTNSIYRKTGAKSNGYVSVSQLMRAAESYGIPFEYKYPMDLDKLREAIDLGKVVMPLVHYGGWSQKDPGNATQSPFEGPHFVVVVGYDADHFYVNDPLWWGERRKEGIRKRWTNEEFLNAWESAEKDGNRNLSCIMTKNNLSTDAWGEDISPEEPLPDPPLPPFELDPVTHRRIMSWAAYNNIPLPEINSPAVATAYKEAMGKWGMRVVVHTVTEDDTLGLIALRYYDNPMSFDVIRQFNGLDVTDTIYDGDALIIPEPLEEVVEIPNEILPTGGTYEFRSGENLPGKNFVDRPY